MSLREVHAILKTAGSGKIIFILDASESAAQYQPSIISLVQDVLPALPARAIDGLYFLGNPSAYTPSHFASRAAQWFADNRQRASLITPIWETMGQDAAATIVVIGAGRIFDLEDWQDTPLLQRVLLVSMGESLQADAHLAEEIVRPTAQELRHRLDDPVVSVRISGAGFMPTWWNNAGCRLHLHDGEASLVAERLGDYALRLQFLTTHEGEGHATMTRASETCLTEPLSAIDPKVVVSPAAGQLSAQEVAIVRKAVAHESFSCPHCGKLHPWQTLRCEERAMILGELIYPSLSARDAAGFVLLRAGDAGVQWTLHPGNVLRGGLEEVAIKEGQQAVLYHYEPQLGWMRTGTVLEPYHPVGKQTYAVVL